MFIFTRFGKGSCSLRNLQYIRRPCAEGLWGLISQLFGVMTEHVVARKETLLLYGESGIVLLELEKIRPILNLLSHHPLKFSLKV